MAERRPLHQQFPFRSGLEAGGKPYDPPLLPYELSLIQAIGCSEEEYKEFVRYAMLRQRVRPAEYDHIPDVVATGVDPVTLFVVNLVVGVLLTAASVLLAPKPQSAETKIKGRKLADQIGPTRFNQTTSFDNVASLAELNQPIPIPFGKQGTGADGVPTGGLILAPALVWSRLYAYGKFQAYEGVYVAGEFGVDSPDLGGILLGTSALTASAQTDFAFYWSSQQAGNRPATLLHGTQGPGATGTIGREIFTAPQEQAQFGEGFSMVYTPSGDTSFGTSSPVHNGTAYRYNWEIISAPFSSTKGSENRDAGDEARAKRLKIAGSEADVLHISGPEAGQPGVGRAYSRHMGFIRHSGSNNGQDIANKTFVNVSENDTVVFEINHDNQAWKDLSKKEFDGTDVNLKDLINSAKQWRRRAKELMIVGSRWIIGGSTWVVDHVLESGGDGGLVQITFKCVSVIGSSQFGIAGTRNVREPLGGYEGGDFARLKHCGAAFYTPCRLHTATIRPVRRDAHVIELGIKSQVWNRASGLCNFNRLPSPAKLFRLDSKDIQLSTPQMTKYFQRSSCFIVHVRPVKEYGQPANPFVAIPRTYCVQGNAPVDQHNFLRIRPKQPGYFEYKIFPRSGDDVAVHMDDDEEIIVLDASQGVPYTVGAAIGEPLSNAYGTFQMTTQGRRVTVKEIRANPELFTDPSDAGSTITPSTLPNQIDVVNIYSNTRGPQLVRFAFLTELLGDARFKRNQTATADRTISVSGGRSITIRISAVSLEGREGIDISPKYRQANNEGKPRSVSNKWHWAANNFSVIAATGNWTAGEQFSLKVNVDNHFTDWVRRNDVAYDKVIYVFQVSSVSSIVGGALQTGERVFEQNSQLAEVSHYAELTKSNESGPEHVITHVNEFITNDTVPQYDGMSTIGLTVKSSGQVTAIDQLRVWSPTGIPVKRLIEGDNSPSNLFADLVFYLLTNKSQGVGNVVPSELIDEDSLRTTARFLRANRIFYDGVLEDSESFRGFLYDNASLQLCNFTIKNGRFGMQPALPFDSNHEISLEPIQVDQIFTAGNIIADSLQLQYIDASQRANIRALVTWRVTVQNDLPYQASALLHWSDLSVSDRATTEQAFDLSEFCTNREQALRTARFLMSTRRRITKTVSFKTVPDALSVQPGSYIRVITEASTYSSTANGAITDAGTLVSITSVEDGTYDALIYKPATPEVLEAKLTVSSNAITETQFHGAFFTLLSSSTDYSVYQIDSLNLEEDGLVSISAVEVPTDDQGVSIVAKDVLTESNFTVLE
ncbi:MAG: hypothetical protein DWQ28_08010 [Proteobacteria bacterium]|nr:MAG: hypothetical protein DWQ28_08010 [Pseudomonadota bacterium]